MKERRRKSDKEIKVVMREVQKEILDEWLQRKYATVGKWTINGIKAGLFYLLLWSIMHFVTIRVGDVNLLDLDTVNVLHK
jgi:hypothetical protein